MDSLQYLHKFIVQESTQTYYRDIFYVIIEKYLKLFYDKVIRIDSTNIRLLYDYFYEFGNNTCHYRIKPICNSTNLCGWCQFIKTHGHNYTYCIGEVPQDGMMVQCHCGMICTCICVPELVLFNPARVLLSIDTQSITNYSYAENCGYDYSGFCASVMTIKDSIGNFLSLYDLIWLTNNIQNDCRACYACEFCKFSYFRCQTKIRAVNEPDVKYVLTANMAVM